MDGGFPGQTIGAVGEAHAQGAGFIAQAVDDQVGARRVGRGLVYLEIQRAVPYGQPVIRAQVGLLAFVVAADGQAVAQ